jgi:hypothetical protein
MKSLSEKSPILSISFRITFGTLDHLSRALRIKWSKFRTNDTINVIIKNVHIRILGI